MLACQGNVFGPTVVGKLRESLSRGRADAALECRRKAHHLLTLACQMTRPEDKVVMIGMATVWMERADQAEQEMQAKKEA